MPEDADLDATQDECTDDTENYCMSDDDFEADELADELDEQLPEEKAATGAGVPLWRLIEMSRENRFLLQELADFDNYDEIDGFTSVSTDSYVH
ncbi:MAG: hypothetical protein HKN35_14665 [Woeseia sp.]|nr:hypothetical protein [Woeseia sp.]MBT8096072.1 hypothetical protein [Woeseia sp.]NNE62135.1 hypothetical protein [Woeseia sp.]NNL54903.1 hypothetical protein [Woeseia sp.]